MTRSAALAALSLLLLPQIAPVPAAADVSAGAEVRLRGEAWDAPASSATLEQEFAFGLARARARLDGRWDEWTVTAVLQGAAAFGLPERGSFGIAPVYVAADEGETDPAGAGVAELRVGYRGDGFGVTVGRQGYTDGFEAATGVPYLDGVKRARIAERLVGNWDWVNVGRRFDGVAADLETGRLHWAAFGFRPLSGGVDHEDGLEGLDDLEVYGLSVTATDLAPGALPGLPYQELRVGLIRYDDARPGALAAARGEIEVTTLVAHWLAGGPDRDLIVWLALQDGDWGPADHSAWAAFAEAGRAFPDRPRSP
ncbi:MAG TPA: alginate export family protein, partial [Thermoanaerobaculia bacterium]|nr:alginate export family protein [Thermoanaerobaculia bacterium]